MEKYPYTHNGLGQTGERIYQHLSSIEKFTFDQQIENPS